MKTTVTLSVPKLREKGFTIGAGFDFAQPDKNKPDSPEVSENLSLTKRKIILFQ
jgi:hypothetical protein